MNQAFEYVGSELEVFAGAVHWKRYFRSQLSPYIAGNVLEVVAGFGGTTKVLCQGDIASWTCLEPDAALADQLREAIPLDPQLAPLPLQVITGSLADMPGGPQFDSVLYIDVLEHIEHDREEMNRAAKCLAPGGYLIVLSPAHQWLFSPFDQAIGHFRRYTRASLRAVGPQGLELVRLRYLDAVGLLASLANKAVLKSSHPTKSQIGFWDTFMVPPSQIVDPLLAYRVGKSVIGVWRRPAISAAS